MSQPQKVVPLRDELKALTAEHQELLARMGTISKRRHLLLGRSGKFLRKQLSDVLQQPLDLLASRLDAVREIAKRAHETDAPDATLPKWEHPDQVQLQGLCSFLVTYVVAIKHPAAGFEKRTRKQRQRGGRKVKPQR